MGNLRFVDQLPEEPNASSSPWRAKATPSGGRRIGPKIQPVRSVPRFTNVDPSMFPDQMLELDRWRLVDPDGPMTDFDSLTRNGYIGDLAFRLGEGIGAWVIATDDPREGRAAIDVILDLWDADILGAEYGYRESITIWVASDGISMPRRERIRIEMPDGPRNIDARIGADGEWIRVTGEAFN